MEKQSPAGTVFIPIQRHLSELCTKFHYRQENDNEYTLGDIYLALESETGYARAESCTSPLFFRLQVQLMDNSFACSEQGRFAQLLIYLHRPIKIRRQGAHLILSMDWTSSKKPYSTVYFLITQWATLIRDTTGCASPSPPLVAMC